MIIKINKDVKTYPYNKNFQFGIGNDHAYTLTRKDVCSYLKMAHDKLGFKYIRFHGIFDDDMHIYQRLSDFPLFSKMPKADKVVEINFKEVGVILDNILESGLKPYLELSFMPSALAKGKSLGFHYKNNITMPKSLKRWQEFIKMFINFIIARYGIEEVRTWYFEVWNEPDIKVIFFRGSQEDYFKLYKATVLAIKSIDKSLRVGGPSTSGCLWIKDFMDYCNKEQIPYDFISTHHYPGDGFGNNFGPSRFKEIKEKILEMAKNDTDVSTAMRDFFFHPEEYKKYPKDILLEKDKQTKELVGNKPLFISEWNALAVYGAPIHDEAMSASFIIKTCLENKGVCDGLMFWCLSDYFEEQFLISKPFHGGFGLINNYGIPKPNFYAFEILNNLYSNRIDIIDNDDLKIVGFKDKNKLQILIYNFDFDYYKNEKQDLDLVINSSITKAKVTYIDQNHTNPKEIWESMGMPLNLKPLEVDYIKEKSKLISEDIKYIDNGNETTIKLVLNTNSVILLELEGEGM